MIFFKLMKIVSRYPNNAKSVKRRNGYFFRLFFFQPGCDLLSNRERDIIIYLLSFKEGTQLDKKNAKFLYIAISRKLLDRF